MAGTGHGKYCGRRCATIHGNQTAALARAANLVEDFEERLDRAIAQHLDRVLALTVDATLPPLVQGEVAAVVPAAVKEDVATQMAAAMAEIAAKQAAEPTSKPPAKNWAVQNEEVERAVQAITRRRHDLPTGWQQLTVARGPNGFQVKVVY